jgi:hypothetical protein
MSAALLVCHIIMGSVQIVYFPLHQSLNLSAVIVRLLTSLLQHKLTLDRALRLWGLSFSSVFRAFVVYLMKSS